METFLKKTIVMNNLPNPLDEDIITYNRVVMGLLRCKCFALIFCISGTAVLFLLPLDFLDSKLLAIVLPSFLTGYIFINLAGIWTALHGHVDLLADISFSSIGLFVNICCGFYLLYYWIDWLITAFDSGKGSDGATFLILSVTCLLNVAAMAFQLAYSRIEIKRRANSPGSTSN